MIRRFRTDLVWCEPASGGGESLLCDPVTGREFALSAVQVELLRLLELAPDLDAAATAATVALEQEISAELLDELLDVFDDLALLGRPTVEDIRTRQHDARARATRATRVDALERLLEHLRDIPHYADILPDPLPELHEPEDVAKLPILDKPTVRARFEQLLPEQLPDDMSWLSTSGTTGERQQIARSGADWQATQAATWALNPMVHAAVGERFCRLTPPFCSGLECHVTHASAQARTRGPRLLLSSGLDIASWPAARIMQTVEEMTAHEPSYLLVDPVYLAIVVERARTLGLKLPPVKFVLTLFELCSALHRRAIRDAFECPVFDTYGASEFGPTILQCERGTYHVNPESVILEVDSPDALGVGRMLVTTLRKRVMPLLRYDTGDLAIRSTITCGCPYSETDTLRSLEGRLVDCITSTRGERITPGAVDRAMAPELEGVVTYCLVQRGPTAYRLELLPGQTFVAAGVERAVEALHELLGPGAAIHVTHERELLPAASGKFRLAYAMQGPCKRAADSRSVAHG
jgi:phenylacetate-CoA ligase